MKRVHERIPGSQRVLFEQSSHMSQAEEPEAVLKLVRGFLGDAETSLAPSRRAFV